MAARVCLFVRSTSLRLKIAAVTVLGFGLVNVLVWRYCLLLFEFHWYTVAPAGACALLAGWWTQEKPWFTAIALSIAPLIVAGGPRHGYPWQWLLFPLLWPYFVQNFVPLFAIYLVLVWIAYKVRRWLKPVLGQAQIASASSNLRQLSPDPRKVR
jgi:hypothetical protein